MPLSCLQSYWWSNQAATTPRYTFYEASMEMWWTCFDHNILEQCWRDHFAFPQIKGSKKEKYIDFSHFHSLKLSSLSSLSSFLAITGRHLMTYLIVQMIFFDEFV
jgi:hypothetical protein